MKRLRGKRQSAPHTCPYTACEKPFRSARLLERHISVHTAAQPLRCTNPDCDRTFAYSTERDAHVREAHPIDRKKPKDAKRVLIGSEDCLRERANKNDEVVHDHSRDSQLEEEADEIVSNAAYLASQMKVARSYEISEWREEDYRNAHQWARWVQESVEDFPDIPYLERKFQEKGLSLSALRQAERAFFDSVLAYEGFSKDVLNYLIQASLLVDGKERDADDVEARMECLSCAITEAVERKHRVRVAADLASELKSIIGQTVKDETVFAKAEILLERHRAWDIRSVEQHLTRLDLQDKEVFEVICAEAIQGHDKRVRCREVLFAACRKGIADGAADRVCAELVIEVCERDVRFFDTYLTWLLTHITGDDGVKREGKLREGFFDDVKAQIRKLAMRRGPIGHITKCTVEAIARRAGHEELVSW